MTDPGSAYAGGPPRPVGLEPVTVSELAGRVVEVLPDAGITAVGNTPGVGATLVSGATLRAHEVRTGDLFAALPGARAHGADFADLAVRRGAAALLTDPAGAERPAVRAAQIPVLVHDDPRAALGPAAARIYGDPSTRLGVLGVTGTSGKTTTVYLMEAALAAAGAVPGLIGTVETRVGGRTAHPGAHAESSFTTPEAPDLQALLATMVAAGATHVAMEVSSHALSLERVAGIEFAVGAFTNLSPEHLDFHPDMEDYFAAKAALFDGRAADEVICVDTEWGARLARLSGQGAVTVSTHPSATSTWRVRDVVSRPDGTQSFTALGPDGLALPVSLELPGGFNVANALLALACVAATGLDPEALAAGLGRVQVPGRMQRVDEGQPFLAVVDYAHKPAAVSALLETLRARASAATGEGGRASAATGEGGRASAATGESARLLTVLGCGGDRDRAKRPVMGRIAAEHSDLVWVTDDNPRTEDPAAIRAAVLAGAAEVAGARVREVGDRRQAIAEAVAAARPGDVVVVAGKGHETGQRIGDRTLPFSDVEELRRALGAVGGAW